MMKKVRDIYAGNRKWKKACSLVLAGTMAVSLAACADGGDGMAETNADAADIKKEEEAPALSVDEQTGAAHSSSSGKEETVYVLADAKGDVNKVIVSNWVKNGEGSSSLADVSNLQDIENVKGYEEYTVGENGNLVWKAGGSDIYYQGTTRQELPVEVKLSYTLDGKEIMPEELAGKSGKVTIRFDYENKEKQMVEINGRNEEIYVPFAMISGMVLPSDTFSNIEVENARLISEGDNYLVVGMAFPGLKNSLDIEGLKADMEDEEKKKELDEINIPEYIEVSADAVNFNLSMTMTMAMSDILSDISLTDSIDLDDMNDSMDDLRSATEELKDGTSDLKDGAGELREGAEELKDGTVKLKDGALELKDGSVKLRDGASDLKDGTSDLKDGAAKLKDGSGELANGTGELKKGADALKTGTQELDEKSKVLNAGAGKLEDGAMGLLAGGSALEEGTKALTSGSAALDAGAASLEQGILSVDAAIEAMVGACQGEDGAAGLLGGSRSLAEGAEGLDQLLNQYFAAYEADFNGKVEMLKQMAAEGKEKEALAQAALEQATERRQAAEAALNAACEPVTKTMTVDVETEGKMAQTTVSGLVTGYSMEPVITQTDVAVQSVSAEAVQQAAADCRAAWEQMAEAQAQVAAARTQTQAAQKMLEELTRSNEVSGQAGNMQEASQMDYVSYMKTVSANLKTGAKTLETGVDALYQALLLLNDAQTGVPALAAGATELKAGTAAAVEGTKTLETGAASLNVGIAALKDGTTELKAGTGLLETGAGKLDDGAADLQKGVGKLDDGAGKLNSGANELWEGAGKLDDGAGELKNGTAELDDGVNELKDGVIELDDGVMKLKDGTIKLDDGALELKDGMIRFDEEGIRELTDLFGDDIEAVIDRIDALKAAGSGYNTFSGLPEGTEGNVKFIYKTDGVKAD